MTENAVILNDRSNRNADMRLLFEADSEAACSSDGALQSFIFYDISAVFAS